jgi:hypothetical protein
MERAVNAEYRTAEFFAELGPLELNREKCYPGRFFVTSLRSTGLALPFAALSREGMRPGDH